MAFQLRRDGAERTTKERGAKHAGVRTTPATHFFQTRVRTE